MLDTHGGIVSSRCFDREIAQGERGEVLCLIEGRNKCKKDNNWRTLVQEVKKLRDKLKMRVF